MNATRGPTLALLCAASLTAGAPPAWFPFAPLLTLVGWAACYRLCIGGHARRWVYLAGAAHLCALSWSLRHVLGWAPFAIGAVGGGYFVLAGIWTRALRGRLAGPLAFGIAVAAVHWLRAAMPEISYPHGQPVHSFHELPALLGPVTWGGEVLANLLVAGLAAGLSAPARSWRTVGALLLGWVLLALVPCPRAAAPTGPGDLRVLIVQPGLDPGFQHGSFLEAVRTALVEPTLRLAGPAAPAPPDLVVWPESSYPGGLDLGGGPRLATLPGFAGVRLAPRTRLLAGTLVADQARPVPVAVLVDARGGYQGHHEKQRLVPAGEAVPFAALLPLAARRWLASAVADSMGTLPENAAGRPRPPLRTADGVPFAALLCFDNAFPAVAARAVADGARLLVVVSNEAWYHRGGELAQMVAMTRCRALETGTPVVRGTVDGATVVVGAAGELLAELPYGPGPDGPRHLALAVPLGPGRLPPLAWAHRALAWAVLLSGLVVLWQAARSWARLLWARPARAGDPPARGS